MKLGSALQFTMSMFYMAARNVVLWGNLLSFLPSHYFKKLRATQNEEVASFGVKQKHMIISAEGLSVREYYHRLFDAL